MLEINEEGVKQVVSVGDETPNYRGKQQPSKSRFSPQKCVLPYVRGAGTGEGAVHWQSPGGQRRGEKPAAFWLRDCSWQWSTGCGPKFSSLKCLLGHGKTQSGCGCQKIGLLMAALKDSPSCSQKMRYLNICHVSPHNRIHSASSF